MRYAFTLTKRTCVAETLPIEERRDDVFQRKIVEVMKEIEAQVIASVGE